MENISVNQKNITKEEWMAQFEKIPEVIVPYYFVTTSNISFHCTPALIQFLNTLPTSHKEGVEIASK